MTRGTTASTSFVAHRIPAHTLMRWATECLAALGVPDATALLLAQSFVKASLLGFDVQGVNRLLQELEGMSHEGWTEPSINVQFTGESTVHIDGGSGHGILIAHQANELAMMHAIATGLGAASVVSSSDCGAMALYTRRVSEGNLIGIAFSRTQTPSIDDKGYSSTRSAETAVSIALSDSSGQLMCVDIGEPEIFLTDERGCEGRPTDSASDWRGEVCRIIRLVLEPHIDQSLLLDVLELSEPIKQAGALFIVVDPTRIENGAAISANLSRKVESFQRRSSRAETLNDPVSTEKVIRRAVGIPISSAAERKINVWSQHLHLAIPFDDPDGCPATMQ